MGKEKLRKDANNEEVEKTILELHELANNNERPRVSVYENNVRLPKIELPTFTGAYED